MKHYHDGRFVTKTLIALTLVVKAVVAVRRRRQDAADEQRNKVGQVVDLTIRSVDTKY